jgi:hypothetical protein
MIYDKYRGKNTGRQYLWYNSKKSWICLNNEPVKVHTNHSKLGYHAVNVYHYKYQKGNKTENMETEIK